MSDAAVSPRRRFIGFAAALSLLTIVFFALTLHRSNRSTLRGDEVTAVFRFSRAQSIGDMISKGAVGQISPAPLMYVVDVIADLSRARLNYLGLTPQGYIRLPSMFFTAALGFAAALVVGLRLRAQGGSILQYLLVVCGLAIFFFHPKVFAFACTERPYGLWNGLWLFFLAWMLGRPPAPHVPMITLTLLAGTATAACFQLLAVGIALVIVRRVEQRPLKEILKEGALLLALPAVIGAYYALRSTSGEYEDRIYMERMPHFLRFWVLSNLHVWIAGGAMTFLALKRPALRSLAIPPVALTALIVVMPLIFTLSHLKGYTMVSRQYIWTSTAVPLALFFAAIAWPELKPTRYLRIVAVVAALGVVAGNIYATFSRPPLRNDSRELALLEKDSPFMAQLRTGRFLFSCSDKMGDIEQKNLELISDWMDIRYRALPLKGAFLLIRDENGRLVADPPDTPHPPELGPSYRIFSRDH
ncbi:MAG: hypothetical protein HY293_14880 [Planctomycetes bacterium]|nr:hypothetical protein [Planctomycetota bacterium]